MNPLPGRLLVVTDRHRAVAPLEHVAEAVGAGGGRWLWLRDRDLHAGERRVLARRLRRLTRRLGMTLTVGADIDLAADVGADGVHLRSLADARRARAVLGGDALVGLSAHAAGDVASAAAAGVDYVTLSPIFETSSKPGYGPALGPRAILAASVHGVPVFALGGVDAGRVRACREAGASGVAVMGSMMQAAHPEEETRRLVLALA